MSLGLAVVDALIASKGGFYAPIWAVRNWGFRFAGVEFELWKIAEDLLGTIFSRVKGFWG